MLVSADVSLRQRLSETLMGMRWQVREAAGGAEALSFLEEAPCEALLLDAWLPDLEARELAEHLRAEYPALDLICMDEPTPAAGGARSSRRNELLFALHRVQQEATGPAAGDLRLPSPTEPKRVASIGARGLRAPQTHGIDTAAGFLSGKTTAERAAASIAEAGRIAVLRTETDAPVATPTHWGLPELVGRSRAMETLAQHIRLVAPRKTTALIEGPTGSGKELVAHALHRLSPRANRPFVVLNCAAIPDALLEAELFGHTRGAFTGAVQTRVGRIEAAHGGTLFLDEIGEMPLALQAKMLRFLEAGEVQRIGENNPIQVDVRVIAATHQPLAQRSETGSFRSDLYYRLSVFTLHTAPLAGHTEDIPLLAAHFLEKLGQKETAKQLSPQAMERLCAHNWPGNVRELAHVVERAYILAEDRAEITAEEIYFS
jgi:DNA-binding NtrC family response regulator